MRKESGASDSKTKTEIELEIGVTEKFENEELAKVERMEFQMVENNPKVSIANTINCKKKVAVELNDSELRLATK